MKEKISDIIVDVARREDILLRRVGKGIIQIPELAFTYVVGREIATRAEEIFGTRNVLWKPEKTISIESGRTDLVFEVNGGKTGLAIEFKISGDANSYIKNIDKLKKIPGNYIKIFCALVDTWPNQLENENRINAIESLDNVKRLCRDDFFDFFATLHDGYRGQLCCIVGIWEIQ